MTTFSNLPPHDGNAGDERAANPRRQVLRFLTGEDADATRLAEAVRELARTAPRELERLRRAVLAQQSEAESPADDACDSFLESLEEYADLGASAAEHMPDVHAHVRACRRCAFALSAWKSVRRDEPAWKALSQELHVPESMTRIVIRHHDWFVRAARVCTPLTEADFARRRQVGDWSLWPTEPIPAEIFGPIQPETLARTLAYDLPGSAGAVLVSLTPEFQGAENREVWNLRVQLDPHSRTPFLNVSLGTKDRARTGHRHVSPDTPADFPQLEPATRSSLWIYFRWQDPGGAWQEARTEFPVRSEPGGPDS